MHTALPPGIEPLVPNQELTPQERQTLRKLIKEEAANLVQERIDGNISLRKLFAKHGLSPGEYRVAELFCNKGLTNKEIGDLLFVTEKTVKFHFTNIFKKCKVKSRVQLMAMVNNAL